LQAANEELRSSAEELETSKEELQSVNEELSTVNQELKIKIDELRITTNDFQNFVQASGIPTIYLDRGLRVKFATTRAQDVFNVLASDVGRPLSHLTSRLTYKGILDDARQVLAELTTIEREVRTQEQRKYLMRAQPYRTFEDRIEGVVLTFVDITTLRQAEADVIAGEERQRLMIESAVDYAIFTLNPEGEIDSWNPGAERMFGYAAAEAIGHDFSMLFVEADRRAGVPAAELIRAATDGRALDERYHRRKDGSTCNGRASPETCTTSSASI
jgi:two-component system, chemotaxis family, CheB/CheR fusion protein